MTYLWMEIYDTGTLFGSNDLQWFFVFNASHW